MAAQLARRKYWTWEDLAFHLGPVELQRPLSKEEFVMFADRNPDLRMEREPNGTVLLISPIKKGSSRESNLQGLIFIWNFQFGKGEVYGPNGTFDLPNGSTKMPDVSWISPERLATDFEDDEEKYIQVVPDFVVEVRSSSDRLPKLLQKMRETWMANGVRLAWLIDPYDEQVHIFREGQPKPEVVEGFAGRSLSGEDVLKGFSLPLDTMRRRV